MDWLKQFIAAHFHGLTAVGMLALLLVVAFLVVEVAKHIIKFHFDKIVGTSKTKPAEAKPIQPPQRVEFPAPTDLSITPRKGNRLLGFGPEEIILSPFTFHILKAYNNFTSPHSAMGVNAVSHYCQVTREEALPAVQELHRIKYIFTLIPAPGEWNGEYQITPIGRDYVRRHAT
jgi:hypothetical protein